MRLHHIAYSDAKVKPEILNQQFTSVFTSESIVEPLPDTVTSPHPTIPNVTIHQHGVEKLLHQLNPHKATDLDPDEVSSRLLKETSHQIASALTLLFQVSLDEGKVPDDWKLANIMPLFKQGDRRTPANYLPVSLTSVCRKVMKYLIHSHSISHLDSHELLTDSQHGFRKCRSTETQLIL
jgi:hypothetical protein